MRTYLFSPQAIRTFILPFTFLFMFTSSAFGQDELFRAAPTFDDTSHIVSTSFFHWYASNGGQLSGPWAPVEGRVNWTGLTDWWKTQIKQVMMANIDVINVHLINDAEIRRILMFRALQEMRAEGYDVPKVAPFLDALITWINQPKIDLATTAGKDSIASQYIRFYDQYFTENPDPFAADYLARTDDKLMMNTWHIHINCSNISSFTQSDLSSRLQAAFGQKYPVFNNSVYMITTALSPSSFSFAEEKVAQFEINSYYHETLFNGKKSVQLKAGYWDQNVRTPGDFLPRDGGTHYTSAWNQVGEDVDRIYIESWNEYDEGTGIYAGDTGAPYILPGSNNPSTDTWSSNNDPYEYIRTTADGAAAFNDVAALDAIVLKSELPEMLRKGEMMTSHITVRNTGNASWTGAESYRLVQLASDPVQFAQTAALIDDNEHEISIYGGIFRGRPLRFEIALQGPETTGVFETNWQMMKGNQPFGEILTDSIEVGFASSNEKPLNDPTVKIFPNPTSGSVRIDWEGNIQTGQVQIFDLQGRKVSEHLQLENGEELEWKLPMGIYQLVLSLGERRYIRKLQISPN